MRVLVLGGTGFIGPFAVDNLLQSGAQVAVFNRGQRRAQLPAGVRHIRGDQKEMSSYRGDFAAFDPEVVLFMVPIGQSAQVVVELFDGIAQRLVALSSADVYRAFDVIHRRDPGPPQAVPIGEGDALRDQLYPYRDQAPGPEHWSYHYDKILAEKAILGRPDLPGTVLRLPAVYGPGDGQHRTFTYLKRMDDQRPAILLDQALADWRWHRAYVENIGAAIAAAVAEPSTAGQIYNLGENHTLTERAWVEQVAQAVGWRGEIIPLERDQLPPHLRPDGNFDQHVELDTGKFRRQLNYREPVAPDEWLAKTIAWERENPPPPDPKAFDYPAEDAALAAL